VGCVAVSADGIDFASIDGELTYLFFLLISPMEGPGDHLRTLEHITAKLKDATFCRFLKQSKTKEDVLSLLEEADNNMFGK
jgi:PTS system fructose-specific IIA component/PTS system nitrogen regulatory IIA component